MTAVLDAPASPIHALADTLLAQKATKRDFKSDTRRVSIDLAGDGAPRLTIDLADGAEGFGINRHAHGQIASALGLPQKVYDRLMDKHFPLYQHLVNGLLTREPETRLFRILDGNVRAVLSDRYRRRDNVDLIEHLLPVFAQYPGVQFKQATLTETRLYVKAFLPSWEIPVTPAVGDVIRGGVILSNSEVGSGSLYIYPYTDRLICTNGMVHTDYGQRRIHVAGREGSDSEAYELYTDSTLALDDAAFFAKCTDTLKACLDLSVFESIAAQMRDLADIRIPGSPVDAVEELSQRHGFNGDEQGSILEHLTRGGDLSAWGMVNALTATARDITDADRQTDLEILGGRLVADRSWADKMAAV